MAADDAVILMGEDVDADGGVFKTNLGLRREVRQGRVRNTPDLRERLHGRRAGHVPDGPPPVVEIMFADFMPTAGDAIVNQLPKYRYMSGGQFSVPVTIRSIVGCAGPVRHPAQRHRRELVHGLPGLRVVTASSPGAAYELLRAAIRDDNPVIFHEHKALYARKGTVRRGAIAEIGKAAVLREGTDVTIVATLLMVERSLEGRRALAAEGIDAEVIDLRWVRPLDLRRPSGRRSRKTGRLVIAEEQVHAGGWGATIISELTQARHRRGRPRRAPVGLPPTCPSRTARPSRTRSSRPPSASPRPPRASARAMTTRGRRTGGTGPRGRHAFDRDALQHRARRDDRAAGAARSAVLGQRVLDGQPLHDHRAAARPPDGLVSETYNGDTDAEQDLDRRDHPPRARAGDPRPERDRSGGRLVGDGARDQQHPARPRARAPGDRRARHGDLGRLRQGARTSRSTASGARSPTACPISVIGGYYHLTLDETAELMRPLRDMGFAGCKFKVGGKTPAEDAERVRVAREARRPGLRAHGRREPGLRPGRRRSSSGGSSRQQDIRWFEEPCRWTNDRLLDARRALPDGHPACAPGQSELTLARAARPHRGRRDRRQQLRRVLGRRPDDLAQGRRAVRGLRRRSWAITRSHRSRRTCWRSVVDHTFVECFDEERDPFFWQLSDMPTRISRRAATRCRTGPGSASSSTGTTSRTAHRRHARDRAR